MQSRRLEILLIESAIFGLCTGTFEILLSLYLDSLNVPLSTMGIVFSIAGIIAFFNSYYWRRIRRMGEGKLYAQSPCYSVR